MIKTSVEKQAAEIGFKIGNSDRWHAALYSFEDDMYVHVIGGEGYAKENLQIIPFNKDTEHLLGTKDEYTI